MDGGKALVLRGMNLLRQGDHRVVYDFARAELALQLARQSPLGIELGALGEVPDPAEESWSSPEVLRIQGELAEKNPPQIVVVCAGVGYEIDVPMSTFYHLPRTGENVG